MLTEKEKAYIIDAVTSKLALKDNPRQVLTIDFIGTSFPESLGQGNSRELSTDAVRLCIQHGWEEPIWLGKLLDIFQLKLLDPRVNEIWERCRIKPPEQEDPLMQSVINGHTIFLNRLTFRNTLKVLEGTAGNMQPILNVEGGVQHGKSYSTTYIDYFSNSRPFIPCRITFDPELGTLIGPVDLAKDLVSLMGKHTDSVPDPDTNMKLYCKKLAHWVLNQATQITGLNCWIVLDNFRGTTLRQDTAGFIVELSEMITNGIFMTRCRLVLIGFDTSQLMVHSGKVARELVKLCSPEDIDKAIKEILKIATTSVSIDTIRPLVCDGLPKGESMMSILNRRLQGLLDAVNGLNDALPRPIGSPDYEQFLLQLHTGLSDERKRSSEIRDKLELLRNLINTKS